MAIRPLDAVAETGKLSGIWLGASLEAHPFVGERRLLKQRRLIEETYLPMAETWVACRQGEPIGFISLLDDFIGGLFVAPGQQGRGRKLIAHVGERKRKLSLEVNVQNQQAPGSIPGWASPRSCGGRSMTTDFRSRMHGCNWAGEKKNGQLYLCLDTSSFFGNRVGIADDSCPRCC